jgi:3-phosphoshikimate 1-carboxyvinyltransferase
MKNEFRFVGRIPSSKSLLNRALIIQSFKPDLMIHGSSSAEDVQKMIEGLKAFSDNQVIDCGSAGTVLRFLTLRASRQPGEYVFVGSERLFSRPNEELMAVLGQLGCEAKWDSGRLLIRSFGWKPYGDMITVRSDRSSQFLSGLILNAWTLPFDLFLSLSSGLVSRGYLEMTLRLCRHMGMECEFSGREIFIPKHQRVGLKDVVTEIDLSSAFALSACALQAGHITLTDFPRPSLQPDAQFVQILEKMGAQISFQKNQLRVSKTQKLLGIEVNLMETPDLFPVLSALCALAEGPSKLFGARQLAYKESHRIEKTAELLKPICPDLVVTEDSLSLNGHNKKLPTEVPPYHFDPDQDHRMAMAAAVLLKAGYPIELKNSQVVNKSFPEFWAILQEQRI